MSIRDVIAEAISEDRERSWYGYVAAQNIKSVEFRKGCAELDVEFFDIYDDSDTPRTEHVTIDAAPVLTALLRWAMATEVTHED